jgi:hypothetical protein
MKLEDVLREVERWSGGGTTSREQAERLIRAAWEARQPEIDAARAEGYEAGMREAERIADEECGGAHCISGRE